MFTVAAGCGGDDSFKPPDAATCAVYLWEPGDGELETWPSMEYLAPDESTETGYSFAMTEERFPALAAFGSHVAMVEEQLPAIDGFGIHGATYAEFSRPFDPNALPIADGAAYSSDSVGIVVFGEDGLATLHPVSITTVPDNVTDAHLLVATPMVPLPESSWAAFFVTGGAVAASVDGCVAPSAGMRHALDHPDAKQGEAIDALVELGVIERARDLVVLQPFVTQSVFSESLAIAADIASRPDEDFAIAIDRMTDCEVLAKQRYCVGELTVTDYRNAEGAIELDASGAAIRQATYVLPVHMWIPNSATGPSQAFVLGHGIGTNLAKMVDIAWDVFERAADEGTIIIGVDSLEHGTHPTADSTEELDEVMNFFAVDLLGKQVDALRLRGNLGQSNFDKLQLTRALLANPDLDRDGTDDLDASRLAYIGVSLGAVMGSEFLSLTDAYQSAVLSMPGGRMSDIVNDDASDLAVIKVLLIAQSTRRSPATVAKLFTILQTLLDRGDSSSYASHLLRDRFELAPETPDIMVMNVIDDGVIPNAENWYFARAMGVPLAPQVLVPVPGLVAEGASPIASNIETETGAVTAGLLQFDVVERASGEVVAAEHGNMTQSTTGLTAIFEFLASKWYDGEAVIVDPYEVTGLPHGLPAD